MAVASKRFDVHLVALDPATGAETAKTRPCLIVSPDEMNESLATVIIVPMTTVLRGWPTRISVTFRNKKGEIALDQIRAVDKTRLVKKTGRIDRNTASTVANTLGEMFAL